MKFCGKCHKMVVTKLTNANNKDRVCLCDLDRGVLISESVLSSIRADVLGLTDRSSRREAMRDIREVERNMVEVQTETDNS